MATVFVGGSALLIAGAMAALAFGFANGEDSLVWTALVASGIAALFLVIAYVISRRELRRATRARSGSYADSDTGERPPETVAPTEENEAKEAAQQAPESTATSERVDGDPSGEGEDDSSVSSTAALSGASATSTKPSTSKKPSAPGTAAAAKPSSPSDSVVGISSKKKFHRPDCRYAKSDSAEEMTRATARKHGYTPCGICKP